jgi:hypothetical protein
VAVGKSVHGIKANVEVAVAGVDSQNINASTIVHEFPTSTTLVNPVSLLDFEPYKCRKGYNREFSGYGAHPGRVPAGDGRSATNIGEPGYLALCGPPILGNEAIDAVRASYGFQRPHGNVIALII